MAFLANSIKETATGVRTCIEGQGYNQASWRGVFQPHERLDRHVAHSHRAGTHLWENRSSHQQGAVRQAGAAQR
jgi:hypothetical protein